MPVDPGSSESDNQSPMTPDGQTMSVEAAMCNCRHVLDGLATCREVLGRLSDHERLAVLCTLASEMGLTVTPDAEPTSGAQQLGGPRNLDWAKEFVAQVVLSDALMGAALRLDESKQEIDGIAARLEQVVEDKSHQLEQSEARYERLFERVKEGVFLCDAAGRFLDVNPAVVELLGYESKEALVSEHTFGRLFADTAAWDDLHASLLEQQYVQDVQCELVRRDGTHAHVLVTAMLVQDGDGQTAGFEGIWHDVTERQRMHEQAIQAQRLEAVRQMVVTCSHEINQPLTVLCNYVQLLLERCDTEGGDADIPLAMSEEAAKLAEVMLKIGRIREIRTKPYVAGIEMLDLDLSSSDEPLDGPPGES